MRDLRPYVEFKRTDRDRDRFLEEAPKLLNDLESVARNLVGSDHDAEDLTQETYHNAIRGWRTFRPGADLRGWLVSILCNLNIDHRRRQQREPEFLTINENHGATYDESPPTPTLDALAELPPALRDVVQLVHIDGYDDAEAAQMLDISLRTLERRLNTARRTLKLALADIRV